jgi:hypothetical protein
LPTALPPRGAGPAYARGATAFGNALGVGFDPATAAGAGAVAAFAPQIIGRALQSDAGRAALKKAIAEGNGQRSSRALVTIANVIRTPPVTTGPALRVPESAGRKRG